MCKAFKNTHGLILFKLCMCTIYVCILFGRDANVNVHIHDVCLKVSSAPATICFLILAPYKRMLTHWCAIYINFHCYHCSFVSNAQEAPCRLLARWWRSQIPWARGCWCRSGAVCSTGTAAHIEDGWRCCGGNACILRVWARKRWVSELGLNFVSNLLMLDVCRVLRSSGAPRQLDAQRGAGHLGFC